MLTTKEIKLYNSISFFDRYKSIAEMHQKEASFDLYDVEKIGKSLKNCDFEFKYNRKEQFFSKTQLIGKLEFRVNLSIKYGVIEPIIWCKNHNNNKQLGGAVTRTCRLIQMCHDKSNTTLLPYPRFNTYEELEKILKGLIFLAEDFKSEVLSSQILEDIA